MLMKNNRITATVCSVTGLLIVSKLLGFIKQMVTAAAFGATLETDLINLSFGFVDDLQYLLTQTLITALVTIYIHTREQGGEEAACRFAFHTWKAFTLISSGIALLAALCAPLMARLLAPGYDADTSARLSRCLRLVAPAILLFVWIAISNALLHANKRFFPGEIISIHQSLWMIVLVLLFKARIGVSIMLVAFGIYSLWNTGYTALLSRRYWRVSRGDPFQNPSVRELLKMMLPLLLGYSLVYVNQLVDKSLVSGLATGSVTALNYAAVLSNLVGTFIITFSSVLFTYVTARIASDDQTGAAELTDHAAVVLLSVFLPVCLLTIFYAEEVVSIVYARGAFDAESVRICAQALRGYALMFPPLVFREVYSRFLYGHRDSKRPMVNSSIAVVCNIVLSIALCPRFGVFGVTVATSISVALCGVLNLHSARRAHPELHSAALLRALPWLLAGCAACGVTAQYCAAKLAGQSALIRFVLAALAGFAAYAVAASPLLLRLLRQLRQYT